MSETHRFRKRGKAINPVQVYCRGCKRRAMANPRVVGKDRSFDSCDECREKK